MDLFRENKNMTDEYLHIARTLANVSARHLEMVIDSCENETQLGEHILLYAIQLKDNVKRLAALHHPWIFRRKKYKATVNDIITKLVAQYTECFIRKLNYLRKDKRKSQKIRE